LLIDTKSGLEWADHLKTELFTEDARKTAEIFSFF
jgi:hypothetical protein